MGRCKTMSNDDGAYTKHITYAYIDGKQVRYDMCSSNSTVCTIQHGYTYLGEGTIYSIDGKPCTGDEKYHFWKLN